MVGIIEREGPFDRSELAGSGDPHSEAAILHRLRIAGVSAAVMLEAETRMTADLHRGGSWARQHCEAHPSAGLGPVCDCGDPLLPEDWSGEATVRCGECDARWHVAARAVTSAYRSVRKVALQGPSEEWLDIYRPLPDRRAALVDLPDDEGERLATYLRLEPAFERAMAPVLADLARTCAVQPIVESWGVAEDGAPAAMLWAADGTGAGAIHRTAASLAEQIVGLADQVQEWAVEALCSQGFPAVWPECPQHPDSHPLGPVVTDGRPVWRCPRDDELAVAIGALPSAPLKRRRPGPAR